MKALRGKFRAVVLMGAGASVLAFSAGANAQSQQSNDNKWPYKVTDEAPLLAVVGDVSCQPGEAEEGEAAKNKIDSPAREGGV